eukprot:TRINITY_DN7781_c3_g1_i1.p1 TRINITY_DN7781_c3_g1~~TRINITY_DN7781_c3_g1_i1.p1  ORF type:complete len:675 (+),score=105.96 TRINITY_DN7781_c3_g1_i1:86-2110(+)
MAGQCDPRHVDNEGKTEDKNGKTACCPSLLLLRQLLAEEREKLSSFIRESHEEIEARFEQKEVTRRVANTSETPCQGGDSLVGVSAEHIPRLACSKVIQPLFKVDPEPPPPSELLPPCKKELPNPLDGCVDVHSPKTCWDDALQGDPSTTALLSAPSPDENLKAHLCADEATTEVVSAKPRDEAVPAEVRDDKGPADRANDGRWRSSLASVNTENMPDMVSRTSTGKKMKIRRQFSVANPSRARRILNNPYFESVFAALIFINAISMGLEQQYMGMDTGYNLQMPGRSRPAKQVWPHAEVVFFTLETFFGIIFTVEVIVKLVVFRSDFFKSLWNLYDTLIITCWFIGNLSLLKVLQHPQVLRLARMGRLLRLLRFAKAFQVFDVLHLLVRSMVACMTALMWSALFLALVMMGVAILLIYLLQEEFENEAIPLGERHLLYKYFGNFSNGMFSMFELTMGNWVPISRTVIDNVSEWYMIVFVVYRTFVGFAVLKVVTAIFNAETFRVTQSDDDIMLLHKERQISIHCARMQQLLFEGDESDDGYLNLREFKNLMRDKKVQKWLLAQDIELKDIELAFRMIDTSGDSRVSPEELVRGLARLKGAARSSDMVTILHAFRRIELLMDDVTNAVQGSSVEAKHDGSCHEVKAPPPILTNTVSQKFFECLEAPKPLTRDVS